MQDETVLTAVVIHGIIALACVAGGLFALWKGHNVYRDRVRTDTPRCTFRRQT